MLYGCFTRPNFNISRLNKLENCPKQAFFAGEYAVLNDLLRITNHLLCITNDLPCITKPVICMAKPLLCVTTQLLCMAKDMLCITIDFLCVTKPLIRITKDERSVFLAAFLKHTVYKSGHKVLNDKIPIRFLQFKPFLSKKQTISHHSVRISLKAPLILCCCEFLD